MTRSVDLRDPFFVEKAAINDVKKPEIYFEGWLYELLKSRNFNAIDFGKIWNFKFSKSFLEFLSIHN